MRHYEIAKIIIALALLFYVLPCIVVLFTSSKTINMGGYTVTISDGKIIPYKRIK